MSFIKDPKYSCGYCRITLREIVHLAGMKKKFVEVPQLCPGSDYGLDEKKYRFICSGCGEELRSDKLKKLRSDKQKKCIRI